MPPLLLLFLLLHLFSTSLMADPDDQRCLSGLFHSLSDPTGALQNWSSPSSLSSPCNGFTSFLPGVTCNNGRVYKLSLSGHSLSGQLSPSLSNCTNLQSLDLSSNQLTGPIPVSLSSLLNLAVLNLSANRLSGEIPPSLSLCAYLNVIDLHSNELTGQIPDQIGLLVRLSAFDVSSNKLSGPIPYLLANKTNGLMPRFNASSFVGNKELYGYPLPPMKNKGLSVLAIVFIGLGSGMVSLILSFTAVCIWLRFTDQESSNPGEEGKISHLMPDY
ncbi:Leucine-rich receptor-like protein kinase family protein [Rhynchospora pubera]|uniref:Leucine-rich receptor-like protein kinase family protein n=1 Tax=Rhynchospora pubera TaxID=906938 RepID=A0AAV8CIR5_9POAL|nr:Leucine-rich receptor-like protein kinase family protein [Rhynchospora pubera]